MARFRFAFILRKYHSYGGKNDAAGLSQVQVFMSQKPGYDGSHDRYQSGEYAGLGHAEILDGADP